MEKQHQHINSNNNNREAASSGLLRSITDPTKSPITTSSQFVLQWGNRKRLRCMKVQVKDNNNNNNDLQNHQPPLGPRIRARVDRRVVRPDPASNLNQSNGHLNLRPRPASPAHRVLRNSESTGSMKGAQSNGVGQDKKVVVGNSPSRTTTHSNRNNINEAAAVGGGGSSEKGGSSSGSEPAAVIWPPKFVLGLTNKEKEEDFLAIKGSKLPHRPKKRAKFIQRTLNLVSPGAWLCDLTLERYEVRERKVNKKRPRGLKAMGTMVDSESE